jgi:hypothetical protein
LTGVSRRLPSSSILKYCVKKRCQGICIANEESIGDSSQPCRLEHQLVGCVDEEDSLASCTMTRKVLA